MILATSSGIFGWCFWSKEVDKHGCLPVLVTGLPLWVILYRDNARLLCPMWLVGGFVGVAYFSVSFNFLLKLVPASAKVTGVSMQLALTSVAAAVAPIVAT